MVWFGFQFVSNRISWIICKVLATALSLADFGVAVLATRWGLGKIYRCQRFRSHQSNPMGIGQCHLDDDTFLVMVVSKSLSSLVRLVVSHSKFAKFCFVAPTWLFSHTRAGMTGSK